MRAGPSARRLPMRFPVAPVRWPRRGRGPRGPRRSPAGAARSRRGSVSSRRIAGGVLAGSSPSRPRLEHRGQGVRDRLALEQLLAGEHLEQHPAEGPDVGAPVDRLALGLLGRHVGGGAQDHPGQRSGGGERRRVGRVAASPSAGDLQRLGQAEVEHLDLAIGGDHDVGRLEVAVDHAGLVGGLQRQGDLPRDGEGFVEGQRPRARRWDRSSPGTSSMARKRSHWPRAGRRPRRCWGGSGRRAAWPRARSGPAARGRWRDPAAAP